MKILLVNNAPEESGAGRYAFSLIKSIRDVINDELRTDMYGPPSTSDFIFNQVRRSWKIGFICESWRLLRLFKFLHYTPLDYDLYHISNATISVVANKLQPCVVTMHDLILYRLFRERSLSYLGAILYARAAKWSMEFLNRASRIICISKHTKKDLMHFLDLNPKIVRVIYYGVDHKLFKPRDRLEARKKLNLSLDKCIVLNVGSEEPRKNVPMLLNAFSKLLKDVPNAILVRVGEKTTHMQSLINLSGLNDKVLYFKAKPDEVAYFYNAADLLCFPSYYEGFGLPPLEAMASGCPVIAGNRTSIPEVVGDAGILLDPFDSDGFVYWMREILTNEDLKEKLGRKGQGRSMMFSWEKCAKGTLKVYKEVLDEQD